MDIIIPESEVRVWSAWRHLDAACDLAGACQNEELGLHASAISNALGLAKVHVDIATLKMQLARVQDLK